MQADGTHSDPERDAGEQRFEDVRLEEVRIREMLNGPAEDHDAVLIKEIHKVREAAVDLYCEHGVYASASIHCDSDAFTIRSMKYLKTY